MTNEILICQCHNTEHQLVISYFEDDVCDKQLYLSVHLVPEYNIWRRIKNAIKYIFGYRSKYGCFDEFIFNEKDADKLQQAVNYLKK